MYDATKKNTNVYLLQLTTVAVIVALCISSQVAAVLSFANKKVQTKNMAGYQKRH